MILADRAAGVLQVKCLECEAEQREQDTPKGRTQEATVGHL